MLVLVLVLSLLLASTTGITIHVTSTITVGHEQVSVVLWNDLDLRLQIYFPSYVIVRDNKKYDGDSERAATYHTNSC